jgi:hypothetical protein
LNGDGKLDLISANLTAGNLTVFTNNGSGVFGINCTLNTGQYPECVIASDFNNDGHLDLVSANNGDETLTVLTQVIVGPPRLAVQFNNSSGTNFLKLSWSSYSTGFIIQTNADLTTTNWGVFSNPVSVVNGTNESTIIKSPPQGNLFFRLFEN